MCLLFVVWIDCVEWYWVVNIVNGISLFFIFFLIVFVKSVVSYLFFKYEENRGIVVVGNFNFFWCKCLCVVFDWVLGFFM